MSLSRLCATTSFPALLCVSVILWWRSYSSFFPLRELTTDNCLLKTRPSSFPQLMPSQIPQPVVRRVLIHFAQRRIIKNLLDELIDRQPVI